MYLLCTASNQFGKHACLHELIVILILYIMLHLYLDPYIDSGVNRLLKEHKCHRKI